MEKSADFPWEVDWPRQATATCMTSVAPHSGQGPVWRDTRLAHRKLPPQAGQSRERTMGSGGMGHKRRRREVDW